MTVPTEDIRLYDSSNLKTNTEDFRLYDGSNLKTNTTPDSMTVPT